MTVFSLILISSIPSKDNVVNVSAANFLQHLSRGYFIIPFLLVLGLTPNVWAGANFVELAGLDWANIAFWIAGALLGPIGMFEAMAVFTLAHIGLERLESFTQKLVGKLLKTHRARDALLGDIDKAIRELKRLKEDVDGEFSLRGDAPLFSSTQKVLNRIQLYSKELTSYLSSLIADLLPSLKNFLSAIKISLTEIPSDVKPEGLSFFGDKFNWLPIIGVLHMLGAAHKRVREEFLESLRSLGLERLADELKGVWDALPLTLALSHGERGNGEGEEIADRNGIDLQRQVSKGKALRNDILLELEKAMPDFKTELLEEEGLSYVIEQTGKSQDISKDSVGWTNLLSLIRLTDFWEQDKSGVIFDTARVYEGIQRLLRSEDVPKDVDLFTEHPGRFRNLSWRDEIRLRILAIVSSTEVIDVGRTTDESLKVIQRALQQA